MLESVDCTLSIVEGGQDGGRTHRWLREVVLDNTLALAVNGAGILLNMLLL